MDPRERLKAIREDFGFTQTKMAEKLRMQLTSYNNIEKGKNKISPRVSLLVQLLFGINEEWLMEGRGEKYIYPEKKEYADFDENQNFVNDPKVAYGMLSEYKLENDDFKNPEFLKRKYNIVLRHLLALQEEVARYKKVIDKLT